MTIKMMDFRCLFDAGMPPQMIQTCESLIQNNQKPEALSVMRGWREALLDKLHTCQKQIDCLDYFYRDYEQESKGEISYGAECNLK